MELGLTPVEREVDRNIDSIFKTKPEIARFLKNHPKKPTFIQNLTKELYVADNRAVLRSGMEQLAKTIRLMTKTFCEVALEQARQASLSQAERSRITAQADKVKNAEELIRDMMPEFDSSEYRVKELSDG